MSELTSKLTIGELPNEVMIKILRYLDQDNLKNATLACKLWCNLIESSCQWSTRLDASIPDRLDFMLTTIRKFGTIHLIHLQSFDENKILKTFQRHGVNIVRLRLKWCRNVSFILFAGLLKFMPNLKYVYMYEMTAGASGTVPLEQDLPKLKKLKKLEMKYCDSGFVKCFQKAKLTTLSVYECWRQLNCELLEDFLKSQKMLTSLTFQSTCYKTSKLFNTEKWSKPMPFQLTHLSLLIKQGESPNDYKVLVKFLEPQAKTLKELEIWYSFPSFVYKFVFASMTKLNTLTIKMHDVPRGNAFYEGLDENRSITKLILGGNVYIDEFPNLLRKLPNVHTVIARRRFHNKTLPAIAQYLNKLESLAASVFNGPLFNDVRLPNLKVLEIGYLDDKVDWNKFMKAHPQLTELTIETISGNFDIAQIISNVSLQSFRLGVGFTADKRFFNNIRNKCPDLKVLDLHKSCMPHALKDNIDCKVLRLCDTIRCSLMN